MFISRLHKNLGIYLCCIANLTLAIRCDALNWLHWLAAGLCILSMFLCTINTVHKKDGGMPDA